MNTQVNARRTGSGAECAARFTEAGLNERVSARTRVCLEGKVDSIILIIPAAAAAAVTAADAARTHLLFNSSEL